MNEVMTNYNVLNVKYSTDSQEIGFLPISNKHEHNLVTDRWSEITIIIQLQCFNSFHILQCLLSLCYFQNIWFFTGVVVDILCNMCECEPAAVTLRRFGMWPATPLEPRCAFSIEFLLWLEAMVLGAHVSVHTFVECVRFRNGHMQNEVSKKIIRCFFQCNTCFIKFIFCFLGALIMLHYTLSYLNGITVCSCLFWYLYLIMLCIPWYFVVTTSAPPVTLAWLDWMTADSCLLFTGSEHFQDCKGVD